MEQHLQSRNWVPAAVESLVHRVASETAEAELASIDARIHELVAENRRIHEVECVNLNPATNVMNPRAEAVLAAGLGSRPSLGYPGEKYEMGLEAIEQIEIIAAELAAEVFRATYAEIRVPSGAMANLYASLRQRSVVISRIIVQAQPVCMDSISTRRRSMQIGTPLTSNSWRPWRVRCGRR